MKKPLLTLLISTHILYASFSQECEGIVTIEKLTTVGTTVKATLEVHEHTFKCKGHSKTLYKVISQDVPLLGITPKKQRHYNVKYKYRDGKTDNGIAVSSSWELLKRRYFVPTKPSKPKRKPVKSLPRLPEVPSEGIDLHADIKAWEKAHKGKK